MPRRLLTFGLILLLVFGSFFLGFWCGSMREEDTRHVQSCVLGPTKQSCRSCHSGISETFSEKLKRWAKIHE